MNKLTNEQKYKTAEERGQGGKGKRGEVMSTEKQETIADIVAEMRKDIADGTVGIWSDFGGEIARCYADRIEAAAKREREAGADAAQICGEIGELIGREETRENRHRLATRRICAMRARTLQSMPKRRHATPMTRICSAIFTR